MSYKGISANGKHSYNDLNARLLSRNIGAPEKRTVYIDDIPGLDGFYDLSNYLGRVYLGAREVEYTFRMRGTEQSEEVHALLDWLYGISDDDITDEFRSGWHLKGSFTSADIEEHVSQYFSDVTATFTCQPYWISDSSTTQTLSVGDTIVTNSGEPVYPSVTKIGGSSATITIGGHTERVTGAQELALCLPSGSSTVTVETSSVTLSWNERRL